MDTSQSMPMDAKAISELIDAGESKWKAGQYNHAEIDLNHASELAGRAKDKERQATALLLLGCVYNAKALYEKAGNSLEEALGLRMELFGDNSEKFAEVLEHL